MKKKNMNMLKATVALTIAIAFVMPGAVAFANLEETSTFEVKRTGHGMESAG